MENIRQVSMYTREHGIVGIEYEREQEELKKKRRLRRKKQKSCFTTCRFSEREGEKGVTNL